MQDRRTDLPSSASDNSMPVAAVMDCASALRVELTILWSLWPRQKAGTTQGATSPLSMDPSVKLVSSLHGSLTATRKSRIGMAHDGQAVGRNARKHNRQLSMLLGTSDGVVRQHGIGNCWRRECLDGLVA